MIGKKITLLLAAAASVLAGNFASAAVVDLTTNSSGSISTNYGTVIFTTNFQQPTGTGVIDPFLTIQNNGVEQGYNTSAKNGVFDTKREPVWNHELQLGDLAKVTIAGSQYYSFIIDLNEPGTDKAFISLDALQIYASPKAGQTTNKVDNLGRKLFDMDLPSDSYVLIEDRNHGSGQADVAFFIPTAAFAGVTATDYIYMYQMFGAHVSANTDWTSEGGFEETFVMAVTPVPEVGTALPLSLVLGSALGLAQFRRRKTFA